ncbi:prenyltransferase [Tamlana nanhaiensis]|uniref:Prenyltransferase n=1 Tax=Neotamlana nanhaiensis TaxID=1382798 RepID=A0A0D7W7X1_9FLAO|nr:prenyltransferase [Tamlana nanhaiensis]
MLVLAQLLVKYAFLEPLKSQTSLNAFGITLLILATICIAAAGNIINDIYDVNTDAINKPNQVIIGKAISEKNAFTAFIILNIIGVGCGFYLSHLVNKPPFFILFVLISLLLYVYTTMLKRLPIIGNILISILVGFSILIVGIFDLLPGLTPANKHFQLAFLKIIFKYAVFAFSINLLRELCKDIEDYQGDFQQNMKTLPILIGIKNAKYLLSALNFVPLVLIILHVSNQLYLYPWAVGYFLIFIVAPLLYICIITFSASNKSDFSKLSNRYKIVMLFGILSLLLYKFVILK